MSCSISHTKKTNQERTLKDSFVSLCTVNTVFNKKALGLELCHCNLLIMTLVTHFYVCLTDKGESELQLHFSMRSNEDAEIAWDLYGNSGAVPPFGSCPFSAVVTSELQGS